MNNLIHSYTERAKRGQLGAMGGGSDVKLVDNSNTLTHRQGDEGGGAGPEQSFKSVQEEGKKQHVEAASKRQDEAGIKKVEQQAKGEVLGIKSKLQEEQQKQSVEQDQKQVAEEKAKADEATRKRTFELRTKQDVARITRRAQKDVRAAQAALERKKAAEVCLCPLHSCVCSLVPSVSPARTCPLRSHFTIHSSTQLLTLSHCTAQHSLQLVLYVR